MKNVREHFQNVRGNLEKSGNISVREKLGKSIFLQQFFLHSNVMK